MLKRSVPAAALSAALLWMGACDDTNSDEGGDTHWLGACERDSQCRSGSCWCGICTRPCSGDKACHESGTACFDTKSPGVAERCESLPLPNATGICLGLCRTDDNCSAGSECLLGACVPKMQNEMDGGGSGGATGAAGEPGTGGRRLPRLDAGTPRATDFADVNVPVDFTKPVEVPPPDDVITGDASPFLGKWIARSPFAPCSVEACTHLEFKQGKGGAITGTLLVDAVQDIPHGPFPPVTDPNVGYPPGMDPNDYFSLRVNNTAGVPYTVFDGQVRNGKLDFWTSRAELWASWCALQTSYRWDVDGKERYRCVPQSATEVDTEPGKFTLCTTPWDGAICKSDFGNQYPCACLDNGVESGRPECQFYSPICECSQKECQAGVRVSEAWSRLEVRGDTLVGQVSVDPSTTTMDKTFTRETP